MPSFLIEQTIIPELPTHTFFCRIVVMCRKESHRVNLYIYICAYHYYWYIYYVYILWSISHRTETYLPDRWSPDNIDPHASQFYNLDRLALWMGTLSNSTLTFYYGMYNSSMAHWLKYGRPPNNDYNYNSNPLTALALQWNQTKQNGWKKLAKQFICRYIVTMNMREKKKCQ